jgi:hypothetical protein
MAKLSSINKNERRKQLVRKYAAKYAALKAAAEDKSRHHWPPARLLSQVRPVPHRTEGPCQQGHDPRCDQVELVRIKRWQ